MLINANANRFAVNLVEPRAGKNYQRACAPKPKSRCRTARRSSGSRSILNETRVATLYQPPFTQPIVLPPGEPIAYVRAVAFLTDGNSTEDLVFVNAPENLEEVDVQFVELYTTVVDKAGPAGRGAGAGGLHGLRGRRRAGDRAASNASPTCRSTRRSLLDISASMEESLDQAQPGGARVHPADDPAQGPRRGHHLQRPAEPGGEVHQRRHRAGRRSRGPQGRARHGALRQRSSSRSIYFNGVKGQRAMLLLSDGKDEGQPLHLRGRPRLRPPRRRGDLPHRPRFGARRAGQAQAGQARRGDRRPRASSSRRPKSCPRSTPRSRRSCARST